MNNSDSVAAVSFEGTTEQNAENLQQFAQAMTEAQDSTPKKRQGRPKKYTDPTNPKHFAAFVKRAPRVLVWCAALNDYLRVEKPVILAAFDPGCQDKVAVEMLDDGSLVIG